MLSVVTKAVAGYLAVVAGCVGTYAAVNGGLYNFANDNKEVVQVVEEVRLAEPEVAIDGFQVPEVEGHEVPPAENGVVAALVSSSSSATDHSWRTPELPKTDPVKVTLAIPSTMSGLVVKGSRKPLTKFPTTIEQIKSIAAQGTEALEQISQLADAITRKQ